MSNSNGIFQIRLKEAREAKGLSQQKLADELGEAQSTVGGWESGRTPRYAALIMLAQKLDVSLDYLTGRSDLPNITQAADREFILTTHEKALLQSYRKLTKVERRMIDKQLDIPLETD